MSYSLDLRERVVEYVETKGNVSKASRLFKVSRSAIYRWLAREDLRPTQVKRRKRKLDWDALKQDVEQNPESQLSQRAQKFGVRPSAIHYALKQMNITRKKSSWDTGKGHMLREFSTTEPYENSFSSMAVKAWFTWMRQDLSRRKPVYMLGPKEEKKSTGKGPESEQREKT